jgi:hypothetical protein
MASRGRRSPGASASNNPSTRSAQSAAHIATARRSASLSVCGEPTPQILPALALGAPYRRIGSRTPSGASRSSPRQGAPRRERDQRAATTTGVSPTCPRTLNWSRQRTRGSRSGPVSQNARRSRGSVLRQTLIAICRRTVSPAWRLAKLGRELLHDPGAQHVGHVEDVSDIDVVQPHRRGVVALKLVDRERDNLVEMDAHHRLHGPQ